MSPSTQDLQSPIDPTGYTSISGAQLLQMMSSLFPYLNTGLAVVTVDIAGNPTVPDARTDSATTATKWQRYLWIRQSATSVGVYVWNPGGATDATFLNWQSINIAGIAVGSIQGFMIADNTIPSVKIISLDWSKLSGVPSGFTPGGAAGGSLAGTYPNPSIAPAVITGSNIAAGTITASNIAPVTLTLALDAPISGSAKDMSRVNGAATGMESFTPPVVFTSGVVVPQFNSLKVPQVNVGATDFQMVASTTLGRVLQRTFASSVTAYTSGTAVVAGTITGANGTDVADLKLVNFVPLNVASKIVVKVKGSVKKITNDGYCIIALFKVATGTTIDGAVNAVAAHAIYRPSDANSTTPIELVYEVASGALTGVDFAVRVLASSNGNVTFVPTSGYTPASLGTIEVIEYI